MRWNVFRNHRPGTNKCKLTDVMSAYYCRISPDRSTLTNSCSLVLVSTQNGASRVRHIGKNHRRPKENIILTGYTSVYRDVILYFHIAAQYYLRRHDDILSNVAAVAYPGAWHNVRKMPDLDPFADLTTFVDHRRFVCKIIFSAQLKASRLFDPIKNSLTTSMI